MIGDLVKSHLNGSVKKACELGVDVIKAIEMVTTKPAAHYNLDGGAIVTGAKADFIIIDNLIDFNILKTYVAGECVFDGENVLFDVGDVESENTINASKKQPEDFDVCYDGDECKVNVIKCYNGELLTKNITADLICIDGKVQSDIFQDVLKIAVVERYGGNKVANGFINGFGLKKGAIASSISHDSHNIIVIGYDSKVMADAVNTVIDNHGGIAVVSEDFKGSLPLPIAGLMSNEDAFDVAKNLRTLQKMAGALGCKLDAPFMTMAFMSLVVLPSIKISDKGLFDCDNFEFMDVIIN